MARRPCSRRCSAWSRPTSGSSRWRTSPNSGSTTPHVVALEARQANAEGAGALGTERLLREALRMRPDRIVVGGVSGRRDPGTHVGTQHRARRGERGRSTRTGSATSRRGSRRSGRSPVSPRSRSRGRRRVRSTSSCTWSVGTACGGSPRWGAWGVDRQGRLEVMPFSIGASGGLGMPGRERARRARAVPAGPPGGQLVRVATATASGETA
ncbi:ATPase, T2SS/T4P/T4SS family [Curtobacterium sp. MCPF17_052]|nr:ATPase, T2SS/T4P/T4SS family [Curtobacterium sp. MCPF17_052]WIB13845.1 ATPase, T2SS/T4P/T4SS family [Curtobacterium sp. MCPF17_052]